MLRFQREGGLLKAVQAADVSCAVRQFVEGCAVIFSRFRKLLDTGKHHAVGEGCVVGSIAAFVDDPHAASLDVCGDDVFCGLVDVCRVGKWLFMFCRQPFTLGDVEHIVVAEERKLFLFVGFFVFGLDLFPEDNHLRLRALFYLAAFLLALREGQVFAGHSQQHLIEKAVRETS